MPLLLVAFVCPLAPADLRADALFPEGKPAAAIIPIRDEINDITFSSLKRRVEQAREGGAGIIILEMNTPGGLVGSALDICRFLKDLTDLKTVAWINPDAYSAGAMISLACNEVVMAPNSRIGDCAPILMSTDGLVELGDTERAKVESPILKEFHDSARRGNYDPLLSESMVRLGNEIWWIENVDTGERRFILARDKTRLFEEEPDAWSPVKTMIDPSSGEGVPVQQPVVSERDLLTLTQTEAVAYGFAKALVADEDALRAHYGIEGAMMRLAPTWSEDLAEFLSSPLIRMILLMLIALGAYAEFHAPGHFVGGTIAAIALIIFLGAPYITGWADSWELLVIALGLVLLAVELFILPGFGVAGFLGLCLVFVGFIATFMPAEPGPLSVPRMPVTWTGLKTGLQVMAGGMLLSIAGIWLLNRYLPKLPGARSLLLPPALPAAASAPWPSPDPFAQAASTPSDSVVRLGDLGAALTELRPAGKARINGRRMDVITRGEIVDQGRNVEVIEIAGNRIVVKEAPAAGR